MNIEIILAFSAVAWLSILSPGPAVLLALRNGAAYGVFAAACSSAGNVLGILVLSVAAALGLGALLLSSALLFALAKLLGALYLFYIGIRYLCKRSPMGVEAQDPVDGAHPPARMTLLREGFLLSVTNPKPILFFSALFPQFLNPHGDLLPQFLVLTGIFMLLSFMTLMVYGTTAGRARVFLSRDVVSRWVNRVVGAVFIAFGTALLALRRPVA